MRVRSIIGAGTVLLSITAFSVHTAAIAASPSPDTEALTAGYQLILFDLAECSAIRPTGGMSASGNGIISPDILQVAGKICDDAAGYQSKVKDVATKYDIPLDRHLPYTLTARYAALVRHAGPGLGVRYLNDQISSHEDALAVFQDEADNGTIPEIKAMAGEVIPLVQGNLDLLKTTLAKHT